MIELGLRFFRDECGATAIEYGLMAGMIALGIITVVQQLGLELRDPFVAASAGLQGRSP